MLIHAMRAENFMKFRNLSIEGLPESGLIGIEGRNEGGKSTLGELIQFALFGKTIGTRKSTIHELIHWETDHCMVELDFSVERGSVPSHASHQPGTSGIERYRIWREVDRYGANFARLVRLDDRVEVASGLMHVHEALSRLIHFDFADFERSFYLSEKDFARSPESMKSFLDRMVGADVLERVEGEVEEEASELEVQFGRLQAEVQRNQLQIEKYVPNIARIPEVEKARHEHEQRLVGLSQDERDRQAEQDAIDSAIRDREGQRDRLRSVKSRPAQKLGESLRHALRGYGDDPGVALESSKRELDKVKSRLTRLVTVCEAFDELCGRVDAAEKALNERLSGDGVESFPAVMRHLDERLEKEQGRRGRSAMWSVLWLIAAVVLGVATAAQHFEFLGRAIVPLEGNAQLGAVIGGGIGALLLLILSIWTAAGISRRRHAAQGVKSDLEQLEKDKAKTEQDRDFLKAFPRDTVLIDDVNRSLSDTHVKDVQSALTDFLQRYRETVGESGGVEATTAQLAEEEHKIVQRLRSRSKEIKKERQKSAEAQRTEQSKRDRAESEIREYQKQEGRKSELESQNQKLEQDADAIREQLETRRLLVQLLRETVASSRHRAGPAIGKTLRRLIPHITGGRYTDLQVTPELQLRLFTSEKSDFLSATELSGGTYQGLSLGFRLAYSQAFIKAVVQAPQFVFLDEPFKGMDRIRVHTTLSVLTRLSPELRQILVVIPGIEDEDRELFDAIVATQVGQGELALRVDANSKGSRHGTDALLGSSASTFPSTPERLPWDDSDAAETALSDSSLEFDSEADRESGDAFGGDETTVTKKTGDSSSESHELGGALHSGNGFSRDGGETPWGSVGASGTEGDGDDGSDDCSDLQDDGVADDLAGGDLGGDDLAGDDLAGDDLAGDRGEDREGISPESDSRRILPELEREAKEGEEL